MDSAQSLIEAGDVNAGMFRLISELRAIRAGLTAANWRTFIETQAMPHPIREYVHQDPFTHRAFSKPRGYPGDAVLLDQIYSAGTIFAPPLLEPSEVGRAVLEFTTRSPACRAVRFRRFLLATRMEETLLRIPSARILSIAAGHLRELESARLLSNGHPYEITAIDQDEESLETIRRDYGKYPIRCLRHTVRDMLRGNHSLAGYDLAYAAGLLDYLPQPVGRQLLRQMHEMLVPGGELLIANFLPDIRDVGYMESFMDWPLLYRTREEIEDLLHDIPRTEVAEVKYSTDPDENIGFLVARKRI